MSLIEEFRELRDRRLIRGLPFVPSTLQGVTKSRIKQVLKKINRDSTDMVDVVFALLDDETDSFFAKTPPDTKFSHGASTAQIGCHVGILQRGGNKLDREGRDYWIKPLRDLGIIIPVYYDPRSNLWLTGHPVPKSPNSAYRLSMEFTEILKSQDESWIIRLEEWIEDSRIRKRLELQAQEFEKSKALVSRKHPDLISACLQVYLPHFLPNYRVIFVDVEDGERVTLNEKNLLLEAGIEITLADSMPDVLLWNEKTDFLWAIEAVISDGEVDTHKVEQLTALSIRAGKSGIGFTTAYYTWRDAARRQGRYKNIAPGTFIWILEDPSKQYRVEEFEPDLD